MNSKMTIDKVDNEWCCSVYKYDSLPFSEYKDELIKVITANTYSELITKIAEKGVFDLINKNN